MSDIGLRHGDLMVVERAEILRYGNIVMEGEFRLSAKEPRVMLQPMNPAFSPIFRPGRPGNLRRDQNLSPQNAGELQPIGAG